MSCLGPSLLSQGGGWGAIMQVGITSVDLSVRPGNADAGKEEKWI